MRASRSVVMAVWIAACGDDGPAAPDATIDTVDPRVEMSMRDQIQAIENGSFTGAELTQLYLDRVSTVDTKFNAVIATDPNAAATAAALDASRGTGARLQGAVILVKDNIDTQGLATTAGSVALAKNVPAADAFAIARLRAANGVVLGKANLSEWANFRGTRSISGWSSLGGQTANGVLASKNPCGSSSGSAAAVAAGLASAALGTETNGSIICPSSMNGVVGFKPTVGLVSRTNIIPVSVNQDTIGPITRTVGDAARLLSVLAGTDAADAATQSIPTTMSLDFEAPLATATLQGKRLGVVNFGFDVAVGSLFAQERARLEAAGATVIDVALDVDGANWGTDQLTTLLYEFKDGLNRYLSSHVVAGQPASLAELINYNSVHAPQVMPYFGQELFVMAQGMGDLSTQAYIDARQRLLALFRTNGIDAVMTANNLDALISPSAGAAWTLSTSVDPGVVVASAPAAIAGYPHLTVPMGKLGLVPIGMSFFGRAWDDAKILALGYAYEQLPR